MQENEELPFNYAINITQLGNISNMIEQAQLLHETSNLVTASNNIQFSDTEIKANGVKAGYRCTNKPRNILKNRSYAKTYKRSLNPIPKVYINPEILRKLGYTAESNFYFIDSFLNKKFALKRKLMIKMNRMIIMIFLKIATLISFSIKQIQ